MHLSRLTTPEHIAITGTGLRPLHVSGREMHGFGLMGSNHLFSSFKSNLIVYCICFALANAYIQKHLFLQTILSKYNVPVSLAIFRMGNDCLNIATLAAVNLTVCKIIQVN